MVIKKLFKTIVNSQEMKNFPANVGIVNFKVQILIDETFLENLILKYPFIRSRLYLVGAKICSSFCFFFGFV